MLPAAGGCKPSAAVLYVDWQNLEPPTRLLGVDQVEYGDEVNPEQVQGEGEGEGMYLVPPRVVARSA